MLAEQAINDELQGSVPGYLRCGGVVNNQIKNYCWVWVKFFSIGKYLAELQARTWLSRALVHLANTLLKDGKVHETITFLLVTLQNIHHFKKCFTHRFSNKPFLTWLLTTPPHLKYVATLPCNLSLMACFADINVSQGSVATYARCDGIFDINLTGNLPGNLPVRTILKSVKNWQNYGHESVAPFFWLTLYI